MDSLERGMQLMGTKGRDLPLLAMRYAKALCRRVGGCMEVVLTAYCWYAETEEGCAPSTDDLYCVHKGDKTTVAVIEEARQSNWEPAGE